MIIALEQGLRKESDWQNDQPPHERGFIMKSKAMLSVAAVAMGSVLLITGCGPKPKTSSAETSKAKTGITQVVPGKKKDSKKVVVQPPKDSKKGVKPAAPKTTQKAAPKKTEAPKTVAPKKSDAAGKKVGTPTQKSDQTKTPDTTKTPETAKKAG